IKDQSLEEWKDADKHFSTDRHNFMARGGELLFLQLANLFSGSDVSFELTELRNRLENNLIKMLEESVKSVNDLVQFVENGLQKYKLKSISMYSNLGWVPSASHVEALLFAQEMDNICKSPLSTLEKLNLLQMLCCMQVLRSLCFQARRFDDSEIKTHEFIGNMYG
ncbi:MAG: hypothetical protein QG599_2727, partial [Pseudomonadota bacterium]|nr:hypothetical protein [Pseudomonadota bacterium]